MIRGIGIDSTEIARFSHWHALDPKQLQRIFSEQEIMYCRKSTIKSAERFAARFAAREAFFKALSHAIYPEIVPFLTVCKLIRLERLNNGVPQLIVDWQNIEKKAPQAAVQSITTHLSLTHTKLVATALITLEQACTCS